MSAKRIVPDLSVGDMQANKSFYADFLGMKLEMDMGWVATLVSPSNPSAQISLIARDSAETPRPDVSIEVEDAALFHAEAVKRNLAIIYPLTVEPWGVQRFFVKAPSGHVINVLSHR